MSAPPDAQQETIFEASAFADLAQAKRHAAALQDRLAAAGESFGAGGDLEASRACRRVVELHQVILAKIAWLQRDLASGGRG